MRNRKAGWQTGGSYLPQRRMKAAETLSVPGQEAFDAQLKATGELQEDPQLVATFAERQSLVQKPFFDALEAKYK